jgi:glycosyltransferase involved in cell wall biosynthesis
MIKKVLLWTKGIDHLILEDNSDFLFGGIHVQMYMWGLIFVEKYWDVFTFTGTKNNSSQKFNGFNFILFPTIRFVNPLLSVFFILKSIRKIKHGVVITRGATRDLFLISLAAKFFDVKVISMVASNTDLEPEKELIVNWHDRKLYRAGLKAVKYFVVQNIQQESLLIRNYNKHNYLLIPQIWVSSDFEKYSASNKDIILWVSNFRTLKRPHWFIQLAQANPIFKFVMVGFPNDKNLFDKCKKEAQTISNISFLGGLSFKKTDSLFARARLFVCTSEIEGFPNTFIQAWIHGCPILTTFDPSNIIVDNNLGINCNTFDDLLYGFNKLTSEGIDEVVRVNIENYFNKYFSAQRQYDRLIKKFNLL